MKKSIYELTKDDWNTLFPVALVDHNPIWKELYKQEEKRIIDILGNAILRIEHFGSTSIPTIKAKPYIDIIIEVSKEDLFEEHIIKSFASLGYVYFEVPKRDGIEAYMSFGKGYNLDGKKEQIYHIHMCPKDNYMWQQVDFRDYLNTHVDRAKAYEQLKVESASKYKNDRGNYVLSKTDFVNETLAIIKNELL
ncbi:GrpB family protein [uncultured Dokdonia sp.]|uniref:GrpB family protein n=1 Tax=uncultured Dokdonia sp. TaxID=575653 RepID=UPI002621EE6E|nr:GrpB family protein [uncultured Dokdonia sp.]